MQAPMKPLKLRARDDDDLLVLSSLLQDALVPPQEMRYITSERRFVMLANRFRWEGRGATPPAPPEEGADASFEQDAAALASDLKSQDDGLVYSRVICGLCFDRVRAVRTRGLEQGNEEQPLNLLTVTRGIAAWLLSFSGGAQIRLEGPAIVLHLEDLGEAWPTRWKPSHPRPDGEEEG
ncbi:MAG: DUF2948 family protein [Pseudomonadota bacterium]